MNRFIMSTVFILIVIYYTYINKHYNAHITLLYLYIITIMYIIKVIISFLNHLFDFKTCY